MNKILIIGATGQFGYYLVKHVIRNNKVIITSRFKSKLKKFIIKNKNLKKVQLNIYNKLALNKLILKENPNYIFYFSALSEVNKSFKMKKQTYKSNFIGCKNIIDIITTNKLKSKFIYASSSEIYGNGKIDLNFFKKLRPRSPYGRAKAKATIYVKKNRIKHNLNFYNAIIFNTESELRPKNFLIPKICLSAIKASKTKKKIKIKFGNINIKREWNWCQEQVKHLWKYAQKKPQDFLLSNGKIYSAKQMLNYAFAYFKLNYKDHIIISKKFFRKKEIFKNKSFANLQFSRNKIKTNYKIYGKKMIIKLIKFYKKNNKS